MKETITTGEVSDFKKKWCNENQIIADLITSKAKHYFIEPILDAGAGLGDIGYHAFPEKKVICIEINPVTDSDYPISKNHIRIQTDFFEYEPSEEINTIFISHALQFLDDKRDLLDKKIEQISAQNIIIVSNKNDDFMGDLIRWSKSNFKQPNPEEKLEDFPKKYKLIDTIDFKATLICSSFEELANQVSYLMLIDLDKARKTSLIKYMESNLENPEFVFNETIEIFQKNEQK